MNQVARNIANHKLQDHVRVQYAFASHEEIGRFGSRVIAGELRPDVLVAVDVNHDYEVRFSYLVQAYHGSCTTHMMFMQCCRVGDTMCLCTSMMRVYYM